MTEAFVIDLAQKALIVTLALAAPALIASLVIGVLVSLFQAATQINEVTLTFIPKMMAIGLILIVLGSWMGQQLLDFTVKIFFSLPTLPR
jgi:flagellar biosynthetic protein FliQ